MVFNVTVNNKIRHALNGIDCKELKQDHFTLVNHDSFTQVPLNFHFVFKQQPDNQCLLILF
jgi:hypothetical protein